jgi:hypothetical protein
VLLTSTVTVPPATCILTFKSGRSSHLKFQAALLDGGEAGGVDSQVVLRGRQFEKLIVALAVAFGRADESRRRVAEDHGCGRNDRAFGVIDRTAQRCGGSLGPDQSADCEEEPDRQDKYT